MLGNKPLNKSLFFVARSVRWCWWNGSWVGLLTCVKITMRIVLILYMCIYSIGAHSCRINTNISHIAHLHIVIDQIFNLMSPTIIVLVINTIQVIMHIFIHCFYHTLYVVSLLSDPNVYLISIYLSDVIAYLCSILYVYVLYVTVRYLSLVKHLESIPWKLRKGYKYAISGPITVLPVFVLSNINSNHIDWGFQEWGNFEISHQKSEIAGMWTLVCLTNKSPFYDSNS